MVREPEAVVHGGLGGRGGEGLGIGLMEERRRFGCRVSQRREREREPRLGGAV